MATVAVVVKITMTGREADRSGPRRSEHRAASSLFTVTRTSSLPWRSRDLRDRPRHLPCRYWSWTEPRPGDRNPRPPLQVVTLWRRAVAGMMVEIKGGREKGGRRETGKGRRETEGEGGKGDGRQERGEGEGEERETGAMGLIRNLLSSIFNDVYHSSPVSSHDLSKSAMARMSPERASGRRPWRQSCSTELGIANTVGAWAMSRDGDLMGSGVEPAGDLLQHRMTGQFPGEARATGRAVGETRSPRRTVVDDAFANRLPEEGLRRFCTVDMVVTLSPRLISSTRRWTARSRIFPALWRSTIAPMLSSSGTLGSTAWSW